MLYFKMCFGLWKTFIVYTVCGCVFVFLLHFFLSFFLYHMIIHYQFHNKECPLL